MTRRSKKASGAVVEDDQKTVGQTIVTSMEIRSRSVETSSEDAGAMVVASNPLSGTISSILVPNTLLLERRIS